MLAGQLLRIQVARVLRLEDIRINLFSPRITSASFSLSLSIYPSHLRLKTQPVCATLHHIEFDPESLSTQPYRALSYEWGAPPEKDEDSPLKGQVHW